MENKKFASVKDFKISFLNSMFFSSEELKLLDENCCGIEMPFGNSNEKTYLSFNVDSSCKMLTLAEKLINTQDLVTVRVELKTFKTTFLIKFMSMDTLPLHNNARNNSMYINIQFVVVEKIFSDFARPNLFFCNLKKEQMTEGEEEILSQLKFRIRKIETLSDNVPFFNVLVDSEFKILTFFENNIGKIFDLEICLLDRKMETKKIISKNILIEKINPIILDWEDTNDVMEIGIVFSTRG